MLGHLVFREPRRPALRDLEIKKGYVCDAAAVAGVAEDLFIFIRVRAYVWRRLQERHVAFSKVDLFYGIHDICRVIWSILHANALGCRRSVETRWRGGLLKDSEHGVPGRSLQNWWEMSVCGRVCTWGLPGSVWMIIMGSRQGCETEAEVQRTVQS